MIRFQNLPIPTKLTLLNGSTVTLALIVATSVSLMVNVRTTKQAKIQQLTTLAEVLASNSAAAVSFGQSQSAEQLLRSLRYYPTVTNAVILNAENELFAIYNQRDDKPWKVATDTDTALRYAKDGFVEIFVPIIENDDLLGKICLRDSLGDLQLAYWGYVRASGFIVVLSLVLGILVAIPLQRSISHPLIRLATVAKQITHDMDFSLRVKHDSQDEIGVLYQQFNTMLQRVEQSGLDTQAAKNDLQKLNIDLEERVKRRTEQLEQTNSTLEQNIAERDAANEELKQTQTKLIEISRKAGMADIANGVLHNIGNVLNSLNVSTVVAEQRIQGLPIHRLMQVAELLEENKGDIANYMAHSKQGQKLPGFLSAIAEHIQSEQNEIGVEIRSIVKHVDHIKDIVRAQQAHAGAKGVIETCQVNQLFEDALQFLSDSVKRHRIELIRDYAMLEPVHIEKAKMIQMLVNLVKNAKESILLCGGSRACITLRTFKLDTDHIGLQVIDTGVGISADQLTKVFSQGFTTKKNGHGFGLHASANLAKEMGGSLQVSSDGLGHGATFTIEIPYHFHGTHQSVASPVNQHFGLLRTVGIPWVSTDVQSTHNAREL